MTTKQLLEIALKIVAFVLIIPSLIYMPVNMYTTIQSMKAYTLDDSTLSVTVIFCAVFILYLIMLYYILLRTDIVVSWIYKEKENEPELKLNFHSKNTVFIALVLCALYSLFSIAPSYFVNLVQELSIKSEGPMVLQLFNRDNYFYENTAQLIVDVLLLFNARRVTALVERYRNKQLPETSPND